jgi:hypothetical protein
MENLSCFSEIELFESHKKFVLVPKIPHKDKTTVEKTQSDFNKVLLIDRASGKMEGVQVAEKDTNTLFKPMKTMNRIYGLLGVVDLISGPYLIVILSREFIGYLKDHKVYLLKKIQLIPFAPHKFHKLQDLDKAREISYIEMIHQIYVLDSCFYFSYSCNLTLSIQDQRLYGSSWKKSPDEFFWNKSFAQKLISSQLNGYIIPMIRGLVEIIKTQVDKKVIYYGLVSRISCGRVGTRFNIRGADLQGNVANFVETEQFLCSDGIICSFLQVRGSIPLLWSQYANLKYTPEIKFTEKDPKLHREAFIAHFSKLIKRRGNVSVVNLTKKSGHEKVITETFERFLNKTKFTPEVKYFYFNFHHETKGLNLEKTNDLLEMVKNEMIQMSYFSDGFGKDTLTPSPSNSSLIDFGNGTNPPVKSSVPIHTQSGVFRVNCIDCCDRTNVVETYIARKVLKAQMVELGIISSSQNMLSLTSFINIFNHVWANNGDLISRLYAGTTALMGDYTRSGERTISGLLNDGYNSAMRYVQNNFRDTDKQRSIDLSLGLLDISSKAEQELAQKTEVISDILLF